MTRILAVDIGSSSVRARVYDQEGRHVEGMEARQRYKVTRRHDGSAEFDADELLAAVQGAIDEARREAGGERLAAVGASCFWHSLMALDRRGRAATPLFTWGDTRAVDASEELAGRLDPDAVHVRTGCPLHPSFWPAKLLWLRQQDPALFASAGRFVSFSDYVLTRLAGELRTSLSMASATGLVDVNQARWDEQLLETLELSPERLPEISDEPVGENEPWFPAFGDGACSNIGIGCTRREQAALAVGTSAAYRIVYEAEQARPRPGLFLLRLDERRFVEGGSLSDGGNLFTWLEETLRLPDSWSVAGAPTDAYGLTFLPLLGGERSPGWNGRARGAVAGLSFDVSPDELARAALEGVCFRFADVADLLPEVREVVASGHVLQRNPAWVQMLADVLERPLALSAVDEASARGAAVLTLERLGHAAEDAPIGEVFVPREDRSEAFRAARARQRELYRRLFSS